MKTIEHDENEIYKFLGVEQADGIKIKEVSHRAKKNVHHSRKIQQKNEHHNDNKIK